MISQKKYLHSTIKNEYTIEISSLTKHSFSINLDEKYSLLHWQAEFNQDQIKDITVKTGHQIVYQEFLSILNRAFQQKDISSYVDILTSQDLQNLKAKRNSQTINEKQKKISNKRYIILTYMINQNKYHYPLSLTGKDTNQDIQKLKEIYNELRVELQSARTAALNQTQNKTHNSFSIQYQRKNIGKNQNKAKQVDQIKSQNQMLKAKLTRLQQQAVKKKANIQIQAAIQRTKQLKQKLQTQNLQLVDCRNNISDQQAKQADLKKQMQELHKKICKLLTTQKQIVVKKKGQQTQKQLNFVKNAIKKNTAQLQKLKKQLQQSKIRCKQYQAKVKKLTSQKNVIQKGSKRGPYSSAGSVRSFGSYNSFGSKKSYGSSNNSSTSKPKSNYSYNSNKFR